MDKHPAACPFCGGTDVNVAQPDYLLRPARLNDDGSITIGENDDASDFRGLTLLHCHGCCSSYAQPASVVERFDDTLNVEYPDEPKRDDPAYVGADVVWLPLRAGQVTRLAEALDTQEYWDLADLLPKNNGHVYLPDDEYGDRYWNDDPTDAQREAIEEVETARALAVFLRVERDRQVGDHPPYTFPKD